MFSLVDVDARVQVEGKDSINQFQEQRENFIRDTCIELTTSQDYSFLYETDTLTIPATKTDWINLPTNFSKIVDVQYNGKNFEYVPEDQYARRYFELSSTNIGYIRIRWSEDNGIWQIKFINGPNTGSVVAIYYKKFFDSPEQFPSTLYEVLVKGAVYRFCQFLEGDDLEYAKEVKADYVRLANQNYKLHDQQLSKKPRISKTPKQLELQYSQNIYQG